MASTSSLARLPATPLLTEFTQHIAQARRPSEVLNELNGFASKFLPLRALGAARVPLQAADWRSSRLGGDVYAPR